MHRLRPRTRLVAGACLLLSSLAWGDGLRIETQLQSAGGGAMRGGRWTLDGSIGQPVVGAAARGGRTLDAGFWQRVDTPARSALIFRDGFGGGSR